MARLARSAAMLQLKIPTVDFLLAIHRQAVEFNQLSQGLIYLQISRGCDQGRFFKFPDANTPPTIIAFTQVEDLAKSQEKMRGIHIITVTDKRWGRCDIKTVQLLYSSWMKTYAQKHNSDDAWFTDENGHITEGTSNNAYIVKNSVIITRPVSEDILNGVTRAAVLRLAKETQLTIEERHFTVQEVKQADEAFVTSASSCAVPVLSIDGETIGKGQPGPISQRLYEIYNKFAEKSAI